MSNVGQNEAASLGRFIHMGSSSTLVITNSTFSNGKASQGGCIYMLGDSVMNITNSTFKSCTALRQGGAIYASAFSKINLISGNVFESNAAILGIGEAIYLINTANHALINSTLFISAKSQNVIYGDSLT
jgi:predicted outer membrane repeat protein